MVLIVVAAVVIGYLIGAVPFGYFFVKWGTGKDIRQIQSGRTGFTNALRAGGGKVGALTGIFDILKASVAVWIVAALFGNRVSVEQLAWLEGLTGIAAVAGHNWSIYIGFGGGAGTTPNIGWALAVWWPTLPITLIVALILFYITGMASVVSLIIGGILPILFLIAYFLIGGNNAFLIYALCGLISGILVTWSLRPNIDRLRHGTERVVGPAAKRKKK